MVMARSQDFKAKPPDSSCKTSQSKYGRHSGHVIPGDLNVIEKESPQGPFWRSQVPWTTLKYLELYFEIIMYTVEDIDSPLDVKFFTWNVWKVNACQCNICFQIPRCSKTLFTIYETYVVVSADKVQNKCCRISRQSPKQIIFCLKKHRTSNASREDFENNISNKTYTATTLSKEEKVENHRSVCHPILFLYKRRWLWSNVYVLDS